MNFVHFLSLPGKQNLVPMQLNLHFNPYIDSAQLKGLFRKPFCVTIWTKFCQAQFQQPKSSPVGTEISLKFDYYYCIVIYLILFIGFQYYLL